MVKKRFSVIPRSIKAKYSWGDKVPASGIYECSVCSNYEAFKKGEFFSQCQDCINSHRDEENKWYVTNEFLYFMSKNMNIEFDKVSSIQIKVADKITGWAGSMGFVYVHIIWFIWWILANQGFFGPRYVFDPFPYGLLTMIVSLEAIFLATFIMISQNISGQKSELRAEHDYQVNLETEKNVAELLAIMKEMRRETELKHETIDDIKETVEEIAEHTDDASGGHEEEDIEGETDKILDDAGIDIIDVAPDDLPAIEKNKNIRKSRKVSKKNSLKTKKRTSNNSKKVNVSKKFAKKRKK
jgi:uncharacterized membrane protein